MSIQQEKIRAIIQKIWSLLPNPQPMSGDDIVDTIDDVYDAGKKAEHNAFWDAFQENGNKSRYAYTFYSWNRDAFYPIHDIRPTGNIASMFQFFEQSKGSNGDTFNLSARLKECGVVFDTSGATTGTSYVFYWTSFSHIPAVDVTGITDGEKLVYMFGNNYYLQEIEKLIVKETNIFNSTSFTNCSRLVKIKFEGVIGGSIYFPNSPLDVESMLSVINHLKNYKGTENDLVNTVKFTDKCWTTLEATTPPEGYASWKEYVLNYLGWNV